MLLVEGHYLFIEGIAVILVFISELLHLRLQSLHRLHRFVTFIGQWPKDDLDQHGEKNDRPAVITNIIVKEFQHVKERFRQDLKETHINGTDEFMPRIFKDLIIKWAQVTEIAKCSGLSRRY